MNQINVEGDIAVGGLSVLGAALVPGRRVIGTDFVDHRRILQVTGVSEVIASEPIAHSAAF
jgi:hypothetical protein